ncbi:MAG TPA: hypothetical protein VMM79_08550, partial [Longimicrobiales bacterium]|nr:hypothetical protein [Longimicrobiales bacterium]
LGTPHYMSPEQATGDQSVGATTDIYALGCVLYETLVGDPPYVGKTAQAILSRIITGDPEPVTERRRAVAANVDAAIRKALEKVPADRFRSAQEFAAALADPTFRHGAEDGSHVAIRRRWIGRLAISGWGIAAVLALWWGLTTFLSTPPHRIARFDIELPAGQRLTGLSLTPDGEAVFYAAGELFRRTLEDLAVERIPSARAGGDLSISPDGQWIGFSSRESGRDILRKVRLSGGPAVDLAEHPFIRGIVWDPPDHLIIGSHNEGLWRVDAAGGDLERLTDPAGGAPHRYPRVLPGRRGVLFQIGGSDIGDQVAVLPDGESQWRILTEGSSPQYVPSGHVVFYRDGSLWAAPFDLGRLELDGEPVPVIPSVRRGEAKAMFEWSADGSLFFVEPAAPPEQVLVWVTREGAEQTVSIPAGVFRVPPELSPSGSILLLTQNEKIWIHDLARGVTERLTGDSASEWQGIWSPSGADVYFMSRRSGPFELYSTSLRGARSMEAIGIGNAFPHDWTADGRGLIYTSRSDTTTNKLSIWRLAEGRSELLLDEPVDEGNAAGAARLSPDDRYLAYATADPSGVLTSTSIRFPT